jgi:Predicted Zn-dependent peptidases
MRNDDPGTLIYDLGPRALFGDSDYGDPIIGTEESISSIDTRDIEDFLESYYTPDNMVVSIVGPIDIPIDEVAKMFNGWSGVSKRRKEPTMDKGSPMIVNRHTDSAYLSYSWYVMLGSKDPYLLMARSSLLEFHLINGLSSYLISRFKNRGLTYAIDMDRDYLPGVYYYQILISAVNTDMIDKLKEELSAALLNVSNIFTDEHYLNKRFNYFKYLINDYLRRPAQIAESTTYMELKIGMHDVESFNKMLENHFKDDPSDLLSNGVWSMILPS